MGKRFGTFGLAFFALFLAFSSAPSASAGVIRHVVKPVSKAAVHAVAKTVHAAKKVLY